jgi:glucose/arabinose dehydrogenase
MLPFGIAFYPSGSDAQWVYVANTDSIVRFPYHTGDLRANGRPEIIVPTLPTGRGHWTRDIAFSHDDSKMFVSVGSASNASESTGTLDLASPSQWIALLRRWIEKMLFGTPSDDETERAAVLEFDPNGRGRRIYASGIRNCVAMAINSLTHELWCLNK